MRILGVSPLHRTAKNPVRFVSSSAPLAAGPSVTSSTHPSGDVPWSPVRASMRDVSKVRSQHGGPSIPGTLFLVSPLQELLSCVEAGGSSHSVIHSRDVHPMLFCVSPGSSLWGQGEMRRARFQDLWGLGSSEETNTRETVLQIHTELQLCRKYCEIHSVKICRVRSFPLAG